MKIFFDTNVHIADALLGHLLNPHLHNPMPREQQ